MRFTAIIVFAILLACTLFVQAREKYDTQAKVNGTST